MITDKDSREATDQAPRPVTGVTNQQALDIIKTGID